MAFNSWKNFGTNNASAEPYRGPLINVTPSTVIHATATDLFNGTGGVGGVWTKVGSPTLVAADGSSPKRASVTSFTDSDYFSHPTITTGTGGGFTLALVVDIPVAGDDGIMFSTVSAAPAGMQAQNWSSGPAFLLYDIAVASFAYITWGTGRKIIVCGYDSQAGFYNVYVNGAAGGRSGTQLPPTDPLTGLSYIGRYFTPGQPFTGSLYEIGLTTDDATPTHLVDVYNSIVANVH